MTKREVIKAIYKIENIENNKVYIGQTTNFYKRRTEHICALKRGNHENKDLQEDWDFYGEKKFIFEILKRCETSEELDEFEIEFSKKYNSFDVNFGYNRMVGKKGGFLREDVKEIYSLVSRGTNTTLSEKDVREIKMALYCLMDRKELADKYNITVKVLTNIASAKAFDYILPELNEDIYNMKQRLIDERNEYILSLFDSGKRIREIANETGYSESIVEKCIYKYRNASEKRKEKYKKVYEEALELYAKGLNKSQIARELNVGVTTIGRYINGVNNPNKELPFRKTNEKDRKEIIHMYFNLKIPVKEIAKKFDITNTTVRDIINRYKYADSELTK